MEPEMTSWTKAAIRRVIWSRKQERWLERMRELNIPVHTCDVCSRQVTSNHRCVPTGLPVPSSGDTPYSRQELVVTQQGGNLALKPKTVVNPEKLKDEIERMAALLADKEAIAAQQGQFTEALIGFTNALVADRATGINRRTTTSAFDSADEAQITDPTADPPLLEDLPPSIAATSSRSQAPERRRRSSTSFPLQYLLLKQGAQEYYGLVDTGSQINLVDVALAPYLQPDDTPLGDAGATEIRGITGNNTAILGWITLTWHLPTGEAIASPFALVAKPPAQIVVGLPFLHMGYLSHAPHEGTLRSPGGLIHLTLAPSRGPNPTPGKTEDPRAPARKSSQVAPSPRRQPSLHSELRRGLLVSTSALQVGVAQALRKRFPGSSASSTGPELQQGQRGNSSNSRQLTNGFQKREKAIGPYGPVGRPSLPSCDETRRIAPPLIGTSIVTNGSAHSASDEQTLPVTEDVWPTGYPNELRVTETWSDGIMYHEVSLVRMDGSYQFERQEETFKESTLPRAHEACPAPPSLRNYNATEDPSTPHTMVPAPTSIPITTPAPQTSPGGETPQPPLTVPHTEDGDHHQSEGPTKRSNGEQEEVVEIKDSNASEATQMALQQLLSRYDGLWRGGRRGKARVMSHRIHTTSDRPIVTRPRSFTPAQQRVLQEELQSMKEAGVIEPSNSPHASEIVLVKKKDGGWRVCIDYRNVNDVTVPDQYPLPRIADLIRE
ncbi:MAG: hypothetical protein KVP17_000513, partial [Porospora cf. gigantea B]